MKKSGKIRFHPSPGTPDLLALLNETVGVQPDHPTRRICCTEFTRSERMPCRLRRGPAFQGAWEEEEGKEGAIGKVYFLTDAEKMDGRSL